VIRSRHVRNHIIFEEKISIRFIGFIYKDCKVDVRFLDEKSAAVLKI
jgi:hypothetical protein